MFSNYSIKNIDVYTIILMPNFGKYKFEIDRINDKADFFLITFLNYARKNLSILDKETVEYSTIYIYAKTHKMSYFMALSRFTTKF